MTKQRGSRGVVGWLWDVCLAALITVLAVVAAVELVKTIWPLLLALAIGAIAIWCIVILIRWWRWRW